MRDEETLEYLKRAAAERAVAEHVESGMVLGLGTGSTASFVVRKVGELLASGELKDVRGIPTSAQTAALADEVGIPLVTLVETRPHLTIDGADEVEPVECRAYGGFPRDLQVLPGQFHRATPLLGIPDP